jgi:hypothetical protein
LDRVKCFGSRHAGCHLLHQARRDQRAPHARQPHGLGRRHRVAGDGAPMHMELVRRRRGRRRRRRLCRREIDPSLFDGEDDDDEDDNGRAEEAQKGGRCSARGSSLPDAASGGWCATTGMPVSGVSVVSGDG